MILKEALQGIPVPLHPGALRYYLEQNVAVPDVLLPPAQLAEPALSN